MLKTAEVLPANET